MGQIITLAQYMAEKGHTDESFATAVGEKYPYTVGRWRRHIVHPNKNKIPVIERVTEGRVNASSFFLPLPEKETVKES